MWVQPFRNAELEVVPPRPVDEPKVAVCLNANARKVTDKVVRLLKHAVPESDLFLSRSELDARRIAQAVLDRRYHTVFLGGGDGTFMGFVNEILNQVDVRRRHYAHQAAPRFGVLKLGTGNSMASVVNASPLKGDGVLDDVLRARAGEVPGYRSLDMILVEGRRTQFAGCGVDAKLLNDYIWVKENLGRGLFQPVMKGGAGYFTSVAFKTVPYYLANSTFVDCEIVNQGVTAYACAPNGLPKGEGIAPGGTIFKGRVMMAAASTIPFYGYGLKMFPFAGKRRGMMNLRFGALPPTSIIANMKGLWNGTWHPEGMHDVLCSEVRIKFDKPMPFQVAGDAEGYRDEIHFKVAAEPIELVDFTGAVN
jgi:diacylglycerol kinase family enzyme